MLAHSLTACPAHAPSYASRTKPVIVVPGVNHGNTSNGVANTARGDITAGAADHATCARALGAHIAHFLTTHLATTEQQQQEVRCVTQAGTCVALTRGHWISYWLSVVLIGIVYSTLAISVCFRTVHHVPLAYAQASGHLLEAVRQSMQHVAPYCTALGLGDVAAPFDSAAGALPPQQPPYGAALAGGLVAGAARSVGLEISS